MAPQMYELWDGLWIPQGTQITVLVKKETSYTSWSSTGYWTITVGFITSSNDTQPLRIWTRQTEDAARAMAVEICNSFHANNP